MVDLVASRCTEHESGGRMIEAILTNTLLPALSAEFLGVRVGAEGGEFSYEFE